MRELAPNIGRPKIENPKKNDTRIRMTDDEVKKLNYCCEKTGMTKSDVIRHGINLVYEQVKKR